MAMRKSGLDISLVLLGVLLFIYTLIQFGLLGGVMSEKPFNTLVPCIEFGVAAWYLIISVVTVVTGATGNDRLYVAVIVLSSLTIFIAICGVVIAVLGSETLLLGYQRWVVGSSVNSTRPVILAWAVIVMNCAIFFLTIVIACASCCGKCCRNLVAEMNAESHGYTAQPDQQDVHMSSVSSE